MVVIYPSWKEEESQSYEMQRESSFKPVRCLLATMLCAILLVSPVTVFIFGFHISYPQSFFSFNASISHDQFVLPHSLHTDVAHLQIQLGLLLQQLHNESSESKVLVKFSDQVLRIAISLDKLADSITKKHQPDKDEVSTVDEDFTNPEEGEAEAEEQVPGGTIFTSGEIRIYISPKQNRQIGKKNFLGVEAITPSIGLACARMATNLDRFMSYKIHGTCPDDSEIAQKLLVRGCDPLPRRRCFTKSPPHYTKPLPINFSLWTQPSNANILWNSYKCKDYSCLVSKETKDRRGFFKCSDCFNLSKQAWDTPTNESASAEFTIDEVLSLKPGEIRIGLDFSPTTGTFAAIMRGKNVTIASSTLNLGAPFNEVIALRGLLPLYTSIGSRLPFFDNTLDIIHSTLFLDGWIGAELLQFVLFDWDRVLRPKGLIWIDRFFCHKEDMKLYLDEFKRLGYKPLLWRVVPKTDKLGDELFFSAVLEKPIRGS
ncbi:probable methyltransferase At1g29790 [Pyrus x bretschneideri]|uniref:probable methyltransferase At1g29790 n=1 Tax=Pyrus x bretschneideri TaxID=225117 RepID=UPI0020305E2A|nr:probable methyltransferase At1g29790 [Pyrus x bretschneideri]